MDAESTVLAIDTARDEGLYFLRLGLDRIFNRRQAMFLENYRPPDSVGRPPLTTRSLYLILKATRLCNLRCSYCHSWREGPNEVMPFETLVSVIAQAMQLPGVTNLHIVWHGGETTLLAKRYFERAIWLQEHFRVDDRRVEHAIQTNGTRIDDDWARFFKVNDFSVGVSLDIDAETHDRSRRFVDGSGSFAATMGGIERLRAHDVRHGVLAVCDEKVLSMGAERLLAQLADQGLRSVGILNALPAITAVSQGDRPYLPWDRYVAFLTDLFEVWHRDYRDRVTIREIGSLYAIVAGSRARLCIYQGQCMGEYLTIEPDGRVAACDKYVGDADYCFGSLAEMSLLDMLDGGAPLRASQAAAHNLTQGFSTCENYAYCRGGCPHDAMLNARNGRQGACCGLHPLIERMKSTMEANDEHYRYA